MERLTPQHPHSRLAVMSWAHLLNDGVGNYLPGILPAVLATLGEPEKMAGVLVTALMIGQVMQPLAGKLADWLGGRWIAVAGLLMSSIGGGLVGWAHSTPVLIGLLVIIGIGNSTFHPQATSAVRTLYRDRAGMPTSIFLVGGELGRGLWPTAASLIVTHLGLGGLWIVALPGIITAPFLLRVLPSMAPQRGANTRKLSLRRHIGPLSVLAIYQGVRMTCVYAYLTFIPLLWNQRGASLVTGASALTTMMTVGVIGNLSGGALTDRFSRRWVLTVAALASGVLLVPAALVQGPLAWILAALVGIAFFLTASTTVILGQDIFPENPSMGSGIGLGLSNGLGAVGVFVISLSGSTSFETIFWALGLASLVTAALVYVVEPRLPDSGLS